MLDLSGSSAFIERDRDTIKAVAYIRVSTEEQAQDGVSLDAQESRIKAYAHSRGFELIRIFREEGVSAKTSLSRRPEGREMAELLSRRLTGKVRGPEVPHVIAVKLDRLFRNTMDALQHAQEWDKAGIALHILDMAGSALDTSSPMGRMFFTLSAAFAEMERKMIGARVKASLDYLKSQGKAWTRKPPLGFDVVEGKLVENEEEMKTVGLIQRLRDPEVYGKGQAVLTPGKIAKHLTAIGAKTKNGGKWHPVTIREVLRVHKELALKRQKAEAEAEDQSQKPQV
jgi:DNA invertase Pin-like site-specific DNA recombinase